jgi:hypothetical protein
LPLAALGSNEVTVKVWAFRACDNTRALFGAMSGKEYSETVESRSSRLSWTSGRR